MNKGLGIALAGLTMIGMSGVAIAKPQTAHETTHVRGTIEDVNGNTLAIKSYDGNTTDLQLNSDTKYLSVVPSSLSQVKKGDFIGTAAAGPKDKLVAQEVVIFPESMRGTGEGHYSWSMPATVARADTHGTMQGGTTQGNAPGTSPVHGTMTNGTVANVEQSRNWSANAPPVQGTMTNGTVTGDASTTGGKELTISYNNGEKLQVSVPPGAPVVRFVPAQKSVMTTGAKTFVTASTASSGSEPTAKVVAVGKDGLMPPM